MATEKDLKPGMLVGWTHRNDFVLGTIVETKRVNCIVRQMSDPTGSKLHKIEKLILESEIGENDIQMAKAQGGRMPRAELKSTPKAAMEHEKTARAGRKRTASKKVDVEEAEEAEAEAEPEPVTPTPVKKTKAKSKST